MIPGARAGFNLEVRRSGGGLDWCGCFHGSFNKPEFYLDNLPVSPRQCKTSPENSCCASRTALDIRPSRFDHPAVFLERGLGAISFDAGQFLHDPDGPVAQFYV